MSGGKSLGGTWSPKKLGDEVIAWFDSKDMGTIVGGTASGVSVWGNKAPYGRALKQATAGNQPTYNLTGINSIPAIGFVSTSSQYMLMPGFPFPELWSAFGVVQSAAAADVQAILAGDNYLVGPTGRIGNMLGTSLAGTALRSSAFNNADVGWAGTALAISLATPVLVTTVRDTTTLKDSVNGGALSSVTVSGTPNSGTGVALSVGVAAGLYYYQNGLSGELIMLRGVASVTTQQYIQGYLAWDWWGTVNTLPSDHPFKTSPP